MAETPEPKLQFRTGCPDCGERSVELPSSLPEIGDDFDWMVRDYDGFRLFMLEELIARFPERIRWTPADLEVVLVEVIASVLDQLSDMLDRVHAEAFLETARRPESVRRLLRWIGYDATRIAGFTDDPPGTQNGRTANEKLEQFWIENPLDMEQARAAGPRSIHTQHRMVTVDDYAERLEEHPIVERAHAWSRWSGSWMTMHVAVVNWNLMMLDETLPLASLELAEQISDLQMKIDEFHQQHGLEPVDWSVNPTIRTVLRRYMEAYRMAGQEVWLQDAVPIGISMSIAIRVAEHFYRSEIRYAVREALGAGPTGLFRPGRLRFGEDLHASDIYQTLMELDGVDTVCLNRFKRIGKQFPDQSDTGRIPLHGLEIAVCDNEPSRPERGYYKLSMYGGRKG